MAKKKVNVTVDYKVKGADDVEGAFDGVSKSADEAADSVEKVGGATGGLKGAFQSAQGGVKGLIGGFKAVIAWDAVVSGIEAGFDFLKTVVFDPYMAVWSSLILGIEKGILKIRIAWNEWTGDADEAARLTLRLDEVNAKLAENVETLKKAGETIIDTAVSIGESIVEVIEEADRMGDALADLTRREQELTRAKRAQEIQNAKSLAQLEELKVIRDDESKSLEERIAANEKIARIEANRVGAAVRLAKQELQLLKDRAALEGKGTEILDLITEKEIELAEFRNENAGIRAEQIVNDVNLRKEQFEKEAALVDQELELNAVLEEDAVRLADAKIAAEQMKLDKLVELGLQENQIYRDQQFNLLMSQKEAEKARLDAAKEAAELAQDKKDQADADKVASDKQTAKLRADVEKQLGSDLLGFSSSLVDALGADSKAAMVIQKATALGEIAVNTARAISSLVAMSSANPANAVTFGGAGIAQYAAGILQIGTNIASAYALLKKPAPQIDAGGGGGASPAPSTEQTAPDLGFEGRSAGAELFGANLPVIKAYVTETDITTSQNTASNIQELSQIG
jgi:hypothetical protein